ncbi:MULTISPECIES: DNA polymerase Y family protein [Burkholderiaceae]|uniref:Y-family DNA polymerase n=1 Tax=Burkholderiaceae TaxID=119060 RepID=UPI00097794F6|nr:MULTISPECIES: DNA polymerase Y family protein [Burkholderiaceae]MCG1038403.1 DNA polymerase Y family protein [Mycetohabitans sp. B7]
MAVWIGVHLPYLLLEVFRPRGCSPDMRGCVVLEQDCVAHCDEIARALGIRAGMRRGGVLALAPHVRLYERDRLREAALQHSVGVAMLRFTPHVVVADEACVMLDVTASLRLFRGIRALRRDARARIDALGVSAQWAVAPTGYAAWLLARSGGGYALSFESLERVLGLRPLNVLPPARRYADWFDGLGCHTIADVCRLPRAGLNKRCGTALLEALDRARGRAPDGYVWLQVPLQFEARVELPDRIEQADALLFAARRLLVQMSGWLIAQQLAVVRLTVKLEHERGRAPLAPSVLDIALAEPTWHDAHLVRLIKERLARTPLVAPVIALRLLVQEVRAAQPHSDTLFPEPGGTPTEHAKLLELLIARLGRENVLYAQPLADHRPEVAAHWVPLDVRRQTAGELPALPRPIWLLKEPIELMVRDHRPFYGTPLRLVSPAERIEAGWHERQALVRDYYVAQSDEPVYYWVYCERIGAREPSTLRWFLHGLFG